MSEAWGRGLATVTAGGRVLDVLYPDPMLGLEDVVAAAGRIGLDAERMRADLEAGTFAAAVQADVESGHASGVTGTPTFFTGGARHVGGYDAQSLIAALEGS